MGDTFMNKIIVKIANQEYTIIGNEEKDYILSLASHVDEQIAKASEKTPKLNSVTPVVLASINIADQYFKALEENKKILDKLDSCGIDIDNEGNIEQLQDEIRALKEGDTDVVDEINELKNIILEKDKEIEELNILINSFQNHIYQLQLEANKSMDTK